MQDSAVRYTVLKTTPTGSVVTKPHCLCLSSSMLDGVPIFLLALKWFHVLGMVSLTWVSLPLLCCLGTTASGCLQNDQQKEVQRGVSEAQGVAA